MSELPRLAVGGGGWGVGTRRHVQLVELARVNNSAGPRFWTKTMPCTADGYVPLRKELPQFSPGPGRDRRPVHGTPSDHALETAIVS